MVKDFRFDVFDYIWFGSSLLELVNGDLSNYDCSISIDQIIGFAPIRSTCFFKF